MHVKIWSHFRDETWEGDVNITPGRTQTKMLEHIFRYFNRVDENDGQRLERVGYNLPSLSVDDTVTVEGMTWRVAVTGFESVPPKGNVPPSERIVVTDIDRDLLA